MTTRTGSKKTRIAPHPRSSSDIVEIVPNPQDVGTMDPVVSDSRNYSDLGASIEIAKSNPIPPAADVENQNQSILESLETKDAQSSAIHPCYRFFPVLDDHKFALYKQYNRKHECLILPYPSIVIAILFIATHYNLELPSEKDGILFVISMNLFVVVLILSIINFSPRVLERTRNYKGMATRIDTAILRLPFNLEDIIMIGFIVSVGLNLIARVVAGTCPVDTSFYALQQCNPIMHSIPTESFIILYASPLLTIKLIRTISLMGLLVSWTLIRTPLLMILVRSVDKNILS